jgi:hypothetical protein
MTIEMIAILVLGIAIGVWNAYLFFKIRQIEDSIPTPEEIAKEVIRVKIPLSDLPPEMQEQFMKGGIPPIPQQVKFVNPITG